MYAQSNTVHCLTANLELTLYEYAQVIFHSQRSAMSPGSMRAWKTGLIVVITLRPIEVYKHVHQHVLKFSHQGRVPHEMLAICASLATSSVIGADFWCSLSPQHSELW